MLNLRTKIIITVINFNCIFGNVQLLCEMCTLFTDGRKLLRSAITKGHEISIRKRLDRQGGADQLD